MTGAEIENLLNSIKISHIVKKTITYGLIQK